MAVLNREPERSNLAWRGPGEGSSAVGSSHPWEPVPGHVDIMPAPAHLP